MFRPIGVRTPPTGAGSLPISVAEESWEITVIGDGRIGGGWAAASGPGAQGDTLNRTRHTTRIRRGKGTGRGADLDDWEAKNRYRKCGIKGGRENFLIRSSRASISRYGSWRHHPAATPPVLTTSRITSISVVDSRLGAIDAIAPNRTIAGSMLSRTRVNLRHSCARSADALICSGN